MHTENSELIYRYIYIHIYEWEKTHRKIKWSPLRIRCMNRIAKPYGTKCVFISANLCRSFENRISFVDHIRSIEICGETHLSRILWTFRHRENEAAENEKGKIKMKQIEEEKLASDSVNCLKQWTKKKTRKQWREQNDRWILYVQFGNRVKTEQSYCRRKKP